MTLSPRKNALKRVIAFLIAIVISFTTFASVSFTPNIDAYASDLVELTDSSNLQARWLSNSELGDDAVGNHRLEYTFGAVKWCNKDGCSAADFTKGNGSYNSASKLIEFNGGFDADIGNGATIAFMAYLDVSNSSPIFSIFSENIVGAKETSFTFASNGTVTATKTDGTSYSKNIGASITTGAWHTFVIEFVPTNTIKIFVDGVEKYSEQNSFYSNTIYSNTKHIKIGADKTGQNSYDGAIRDFRLYNKAVADVAALTEEMQINAQSTAFIDEAMKNFEKRVQEGKFYGNFDEAYKAYVTAQQAKDAIIYGHNTTINPKEVAAALDNATDLMYSWTAPDYDKTTTFNSNQTAPTDAFTNAIYLEANNDAATISGTVDNTYMNLYLHNGVYVYDGTNPQIPIMFGYQTRDRAGSVTDIHYLALPDNADEAAFFASNWKTAVSHGDRNFDNNWNASWNFSSSSATPTNGFYFSSINSYIYASNKIEIDGEKFFEGTDATVKKVNLGDALVLSHNSTVNSTSLKVNNRNIYVINYKPIKEFLDKYDECYDNVANYKEGGLIDTSTPNGDKTIAYALSQIGTNHYFDFVTNAEVNTNLKLIEEHLNASIPNIVGHTETPNTDSKAYQDLRDIITLSEDYSNYVIGTVNSNDILRYTDESWEALETAVQNARDIFNAVYGDNDKRYNHFTTEQIEEATKAIQDAIDGLKFNYIVRFTLSSTYERLEQVVKQGEYPVVPDNSPVYQNKYNYTHTVYTWKDEAYQPANYGNVTIKAFSETEKQSACQFDRADTEDKITFTCPVCNNQKILDLTAYNKAVELANTKKQEENYEKKYTAPSRADVETALINGANGVGGITSNTTQSQIDAWARDIVTAVENLKLQKYTVTLNVVDEDNDVIFGTKVYELFSGEGVDVDINDIDADTSALSVYKWTQSYDDSTPTKKLDIRNRYITHYVDSRDVVYDVYLTNEASPSQNANRLMLYCHNHNYDVKYVANGSYDFSFSNNKVVVAGSVLTVPIIPFYDISGYQINGKFYANGSNANISISDDTMIKVVYAAKDTKLITANGCDINGEGESYGAYWDELITITSESANESTVWYLNGIVAGFGAELKFRATKDAVITFDNASVDEGVARIDYFSYEGYRKDTMSIVGAFALPSDCTFVDAGVVLKTDRTTAFASTAEPYLGPTTITPASMLKTNASGVFTADNDILSEGNQFLVNLSRTSKSSFIAGAVAYVTYTKNGVSYTSYSDLALIAFKGV